MDDTREPDENRLVAERRRKLDGLRETARVFPNDFRRDALAGELLDAYGAHAPETLETEAVEVAVAGRIMAKRVMGKTSFAPILDRSGRIQLFLERDELPDGVYAAFKQWDIGDIVGARGTLFKTRTGELSVKARELRLLVKSLRPLPEKWHGISDVETRFRQRYLDLIMSPEARRLFRQRTEIIRFLRRSLDALGFVEVETPMMQPIAGGAAARPFETHHHALDRKLYLRIAPELYLKRLLVGGIERVYELGRVFRNEGLSTRHNPEFTMLELYQAFATYEDLMVLTENLLRETARSITGSTRIAYQGAEVELGEPFARVTLEETLRLHNAIDPAASLRDRDVLVDLCKLSGVPVRDDYGPGKLQLELYEKTVEPKLDGPVFVTRYPAEVSPLARPCDDDAFLTDRFELIVTGREIANGFSELNDPEEQAARFIAQVEAAARGDAEAMPYDEDYIRALEHGMPPAAGLGIGVDRLVMLLTDSASIREVLLFPQLKS